MGSHDYLSGQEAVNIDSPDSFLKKVTVSRIIPWIIVLGYMMGVGFLGLTFHRIGNYEVETDFYWTYVPQAQDILDGKIVIDEFKGPGYPAILAIGKLAVGEFFQAGIIISVISAGFVLLFAYLLFTKLFSAELGILITIAILCNTAFVRYSYTASTDMPFAALVLAIIYFSVKIDRLRVSDMIIAGLISGFAFLVRYNAVAIIIAFITVIFVVNVKKIKLIDRILGLTVFSLAVSVLVVPWLFYNYSATGFFLAQNNHLNLAYEIYARGIINWDQWWAHESKNFPSFFSTISRDPIFFIQRFFENLGGHLFKDFFWLTGIIWGITGIAGLYGIYRLRLTGIQSGLYIFPIIYFLFLVPFFYSDRFSIPLLPFYFSLTFFFLLWIRSKIINIRLIRLGVIILSLIYGVSLHRTLAYNAQQISFGPSEVLKISEMFRGNNLSGGTKYDAVVARKPHIAYYLDMQYYPFPVVHSLNELLEFCRLNRINYVFFSLVEFALRPEFNGLRDTRNPPKGFVPVVATDGNEAVLYRIDWGGAR